MASRIFGTKCAVPVNVNIAARPTATAAGQESAGASPRMPASRADRVAATRAMSGAMITSDLDNG
ncbi:Uncharacterised protein [Mycobacteroides abscessus subsp. massiliense]|nr:Uncharacterised protein [Mycobacteroides abscessus subsp. massiliense]